MSGRGRGRGHGIVHGRGRGIQSRRVNFWGSTNTRKVLCASLGESLFTYNGKGPADHHVNNPQTIVKHTGKIYGQDVRKELTNSKVVSIDKPQQTLAVLDHH